jgi:D-alanyl-D-alanine carboxypeptidase
MKLSVRHLAVALQVAIGLGLAACGGGSDAPPAASGPVASPGGPNCVFNATAPGCSGVSGAPYVLWSSRSDGAVDAAVNTDIVAAMSEPMDAASISAGAIRVTADDGSSVSGTTRYDAARSALVFAPGADLGARAYTATVDAGVRDAGGTAMGRPYSWTFTVDASRRDSGQEREIQQILDKASYTFKIPGSIIAIRDNQGRTWSTTSGYADVVLRTPARKDLSFRMGSNTKTFVSTMVLQLADGGRVGLDDPINRYLAAEMAAYLPNYDGNKITLRHLLGHTSGICNFTTDPAWGQAFIADPVKQYFPQELLLIANSHAKDPGAPVFGNFYYSNTNYILLGLLIRKVSGMVYEDALGNAITRPWNLPSIKAPPIGDNTVPAPFSRGYWEDPETGTLHDVTQRDSSTVWSSGNLVTNIGDLVRWGELLGRGALLSTAMQAQRMQSLPMGEAIPYLRYGLGVVQDTQANVFGHQGGMIGYTSQVYHVPDKGYTLAFFYNRTLAMHDYSGVMTYDVLNVLWPGRVTGSPAP